MNTALVVAGAFVSVASILSAIVALIVLTKTLYARRRHGIPHPGFLPMGSTLVFGTLTFGFVLGLALIFYGNR